MSFSIVCTSASSSLELREDTDAPFPDHWKHKDVRLSGV